MRQMQSTRMWSIRLLPRTSPTPVMLTPRRTHRRRHKPRKLLRRRTNWRPPSSQPTPRHSATLQKVSSPKSIFRLMAVKRRLATRNRPSGANASRMKALVISLRLRVPVPWRLPPSPWSPSLAPNSDRVNHALSSYVIHPPELDWIRSRMDTNHIPPQN